MRLSHQKLERNFYRNGVKTQLEKIPGMYFDRIETPATATSVPDVTYTYNGHHGWIELKAVEEKSGGINLAHFTPGQRRWLANRGESGSFAWLMIRVDSTVYVVDHEKVHSVPTGLMSVKTLKELSRFVWSGGISIRDIKDHF